MYQHVKIPTKTSCERIHIIWEHLNLKIYNMNLYNCFWTHTYVENILKCGWEGYTSTAKSDDLWEVERGKETE